MKKTQKQLELDKFKLVNELDIYKTKTYKLKKEII